MRYRNDPQRIRLNNESDGEWKLGNRTDPNTCVVAAKTSRCGLYSSESEFDRAEEIRAQSSCTMFVITDGFL